MEPPWLRLAARKYQRTKRSNLVKKVDYLILGGGMANTFLLARDIPVGKSLVEPDMAMKHKYYGGR